MVSRIRIEGHGPTAAAVEADLHEFRQKIDATLKRDTLPGEQVIVRSLNEPEGRFAFTGRLLLHPDTSTESENP